jgi:two-component system, chemotaxis family, sensor kinase CheA
MELDESVLRQLMQTFQSEAVDYVKTINQSLLQMERAETDVQRHELVQAAMRAAHTLKGAARAVNLLTIEDITHRMESVLQQGREDISALTADACDVLYSALDVIEQLIAGQEVDPEPVVARLEKLVDTPAAENGRSEHPADIALTHDIEAKPSPGATLEDTIRVKTSKLDELMAQVSLLLAVRIGSQERLRDTRELRHSLRRWHKLWREIKLLLPQVHDTAGQQLTDLLYSYAAHMNDVQRTFDQFEYEMRQDARRLDMALNNLQDNVRQVRMVPFQTISLSLERAVRDAARVEKKEVNFTIEGQEVELDKKVLEALKDPLLHLLRNAVSHGVEPSSRRTVNGKDPAGRIAVRISQRGNEVQIVVDDDGQGFDLDGLRAAQHRNGYSNGSGAVTSGPETSDDVIALAFMPGISTAAEITEISGRGVGLDVVRQHIESIRGRIHVANRPGHGATITLIVPTSLAITRVLMVRVGEERYGLPLLSIEKIVKPGNTTILSGKTLLEVDESRLPLNALGTVIERPAYSAELSEQFAVILMIADRRIALLVDDVLTELELAVKPLSQPLVQVRNVIGTALLGSGEPVIILNPGDLIKATANHSYHAPGANHQAEAAELTPIEVLVVDDSITTRTLEKNILEMAGYNVTTATNGQEALKKLESRPFDIVISDVQMPQMDGIELVTVIRGNDKFQVLPVILVTSLESPEDRERGLSAGANAYIVKRGFNQEELLKTIQQFAS